MSLIYRATRNLNEGRPNPRSAIPAGTFIEIPLSPEEGSEADLALRTLVLSEALILDFRSSHEILSLGFDLFMVSERWLIQARERAIGRYELLQDDDWL